MRSTTIRTLRGDMPMYFAVARACISLRLVQLGPAERSPPFRAAPLRGVASVVPARRAEIRQSLHLHFEPSPEARSEIATAAVPSSSSFASGCTGRSREAGRHRNAGRPFYLAFARLSSFPPWPLKVRVGANSPSLCPTMFSVRYTGMNLFPLWTASVWPTNSGVIVELRAHVLITRFSPRAFICSIFLSRLSSTYGPFFRLRGMCYLALSVSPSPLHGPRGTGIREQPAT